MLVGVQFFFWLFLSWKIKRTSAVGSTNLTFYFYIPRFNIGQILYLNSRHMNEQRLSYSTASLCFVCLLSSVFGDQIQDVQPVCIDRLFAFNMFRLDPSQCSVDRICACTMFSLALSSASTSQNGSLMLLMPFDESLNLLTTRLLSEIYASRGCDSPDLHSWTGFPKRLRVYLPF